MISIIIPLYNKRQSIFSTIDSVLNQSYRDFELLVIDDGSTDGSGEIVKAIQDSRIRYIWKENGGVSSARNRGIEEAKGEWILFLDADDYLIEDGLENLIDGKNRHPSYKIITDSSRKSFHCKRREDTLYDDDRFEAYAHDLINIRTGNTLFHKECFEKCGLFDERMSFFEDFSLFSEIIYHYSICQIGQPVFAYETDFCGLSTQRGLKANDYLYYLQMTGNQRKDLCLYNFLGMRMHWAQDVGDKEIIDYIQQHFDVAKAVEIQKESLCYNKSERKRNKLIFLEESVCALLTGKFSVNPKKLLAQSPSRYGKYGTDVRIGGNALVTKASKVFLYDHVKIGRNMDINNERGKLIIREGTIIGKNFHVKTHDTDKMNVVIGRHVVIGDNVTLNAGTYIKDGESVPSNTSL